MQAIVRQPSGALFGALLVSSLVVFTIAVAALFVRHGLCIAMVLLLPIAAIRASTAGGLWLLVTQARRTVVDVATADALGRGRTRVELDTVTGSTDVDAKVGGVSISVAVGGILLRAFAGAPLRCLVVALFSVSRPVRVGKVADPQPGAQRAGRDVRRGTSRPADPLVAGATGPAMRSVGG